jgi:hypothetical protein
MGFGARHTASLAAEGLVDSGCLFVVAEHCVVGRAGSARGFTVFASEYGGLTTNDPDAPLARESN